MIYLVIETFQTEGKDYVWRTEYNHVVKSFITRDAACNYIYSIYRKACKKKNVRSAEFSDCKYGAHSEYLFENEVRKLKHRVYHTLQEIELEGEEALKDVLSLDSW